MLREKEASEQLSSIQKYAEKAQAGYTTVSMRLLQASGLYSGPPKYLKQRD